MGKYFEDKTLSRWGVRWDRYISEPPRDPDANVRDNGKCQRLGLGEFEHLLQESCLCCVDKQCLHCLVSLREFRNTCFWVHIHFFPHNLKVIAKVSSKSFPPSSFCDSYGPCGYLPPSLCLRLEELPWGGVLGQGRMGAGHACSLCLAKTSVSGHS